MSTTITAPMVLGLRGPALSDADKAIFDTKVAAANAAEEVATTQAGIAAAAAAAAGGAGASVNPPLDDLLPIGANLFDRSRSTDDFLISGDGNLQANGGALASGFVRIDPSGHVACSHKLVAQGIGCIAYYDASRQFVVAQQGEHPAGSGIIAASDASIRYFRVAVDKTVSGFDPTNIMINRGDVALPYRPYADVSGEAVNLILAPQITLLAEAHRWVPVIQADDGSQLAAYLHIDFIKNRAFFNGEPTSPSALLASALSSGAIPLASGPFAKLMAAATAAGGYASFVDYSFPDIYSTANAPANNSVLVGFGGSGGNRLDFTVTATASVDTIAPGGGYSLQLGANATSGFSVTVGAGLTETSPYALGGLSARRRQGVHRTSVSFTFDGAGPMYVLDNAGLVQAVGGRASTAPPTIGVIGQDASFENAPSDGNETLHSITIFGRPLSATEMKRAGLFNERRWPGLLGTGDSYLNNAACIDAMMLRLKPYGYVPSFVQGHGGRGWGFHADFLNALTTYDDTFRDYVSLVFEGGLDSSDIPLGQPDGSSTTEGPWSPLDILHLIRRARSYFRQPAWILPEPTPNGSGDAEEGSPRVAENADQLARVKAFADTYPLAFMPWVDRLIAQSVAAYGQTADQAWALNRANRTIPTNMLGASDDIHLNFVVAGTTQPGGSIYLGEVMAEKWLSIVGAAAL